ncbi:unnamed protein product, partial [Coccothraustes coccothraustes]
MPRKLPFSAKRKKQQLRDRRERKRGDAPAGPASGPGSRSGSRERGGDGPPGDPPSEPPRRHDPGRFRLQLGGPRAEALERSRRRAQEELLELLPESALELDPDSVYGPGPGCAPALAAHVTQDLGKGLILILNKVDLAPPAVAVAWSHLLRARHSPARVVPFSTAPGPPPGPGLQKRQKKRGGRWGRAVGPRLLLEACEEIVGGGRCVGRVDLSSWRARLERAEQRPEDEEDEDEDEEEEEEQPPGGDEDEEEEGAGPGGVAPPRQWERYRHGVLTLGCVGLPNAGKSSVLNAVLGRGAVGVSRAPGRTRYFQTHFLTASVRLCDCPGLVFPSRAPPELQVLAGLYPIAQLQDPYSAVGFLGSRLALPPCCSSAPPAAPAGRPGRSAKPGQSREATRRRGRLATTWPGGQRAPEAGGRGQDPALPPTPGVLPAKRALGAPPRHRGHGGHDGGRGGRPSPTRGRLQLRGRRGGGVRPGHAPSQPRPQPLCASGGGRVL